MKKVHAEQAPKLTELAEELYLPHPVEAGLTVFDTITQRLDVPLVHSAYYAPDGDCPQVIADWVGMGAAETVREMISRPTTRIITGNAGVMEDTVNYPFMESWSSALLQIYRPDDGWVCVLPSRIYSDVCGDYENCEESRVERWAKMFKLSRTLNHPSDHGKPVTKPVAASSPRVTRLPKPPHFQGPPPRTG